MYSMGHPQPFDDLSPLRRLLADLQSGEASIIKDGIELTPTYVLILKSQIRILEERLASRETGDKPPNSLAFA